MESNKKKLRKKLLQILNNLSDEYVKDSSDNIFSKLIKTREYNKAKVIFIYLSKDKEVQTKKIIEDAWSTNKIVLVPYIFEDGKMLPVQINNFDNLKRNIYNILEPKELKIYDKNDIDLIILPCISANNKGERLGYGGGYYDRFLEKSNSRTICLCHEKLVAEDIPMTDKDIYIDIVIY